MYLFVLLLQKIPFVSKYEYHGHNHNIPVFSPRCVGVWTFLLLRHRLFYNRMGASMPNKFKHVRMVTALASHNKMRRSSIALPNTRQSRVNVVMAPANSYK